MNPFIHLWDDLPTWMNMVLVILCTILGLVFVLLSAMDMSTTPLMEMHWKQWLTLLASVILFFAALLNGCSYVRNKRRRNKVPSGPTWIA